MKTKTVEQFKEDCLKVVKHYQKDVDIDVEIILEGKPSIFFAYESGSHCIRLYRFEEYPKAGERVRYLFGKVNRERILQDVGSILECESVKNAKLVHYFNGKGITQINHDKAAEIIANYKENMWKMFKPTREQNL